MKLSDITHIESLIAMYDAKANALRLALDILQTAATEKKAPRSKNILAEAITLESQRMNGHRPATLLLGDGLKKRGGVPGKRTGDWKKKKLAEAAERAAFLDTFSQTEPRDSERSAKSINSYIVHGYLKRTKDGQYLRTSKPYAGVKRFKTTAPSTNGSNSHDEPTPDTPTYHKSVQRFLWRFSKKKAIHVDAPWRTLPENTLRVLIERGYLMQNAKGGYLRTDKTYSQKNRSAEA